MNLSDYCASTCTRKNEYHIDCIFNNYNFKKHQQFECRVTNVYDITKFWIVIKHKELELFQQYLQTLYTSNDLTLTTIPRDEIKKGLHCVAYTCSSYYRGVVVSLSPATKTCEIKAKIYFFDWGLMELINPEDLYYMSDFCERVPPFAVRASLANVCPCPSSPTGMWDLEPVEVFANSVFYKVLNVEVVNVCPASKSIDILISIPDGENPEEMPLIIHKQLIDSDLAAVPSIVKSNKILDDGQEYVFKYPYLFPTFETLEAGKFPFCLLDSTLLNGINRLYKVYHKKETETKNNEPET